MTAPSTRRPRQAPALHVDAEDVPRLGVGHWYSLGLVLLMLAVIVVGTAVGLVVRDGSAARTALLRHVDPAVLESGRLSTSVSAEVGAIRSYSLTGDKTAPATYRQAESETTASLASITRLLRDTPHAGPARAAIAEVGSRAAAWRHDYADPLTNGTGKPSAAFGEQRFAAVRDAVATARTRLAELQHRSADRLDRKVDLLYEMLVGGAVVLVVGALGLTLLIRRTVLRPVAALTGQVRRVSQGDLTHPLRVAGPAELAELAAHVDAMRNHILEEWREASEARAKLDEQTRELRRSNAELEQFAYVASHDLQEPLRKVASFCQMLERRYADVLDDRGRQYIDFAVDGAKRMQSLINDLLNFSRVGRVNRDMTVVNCETVLAAALDNLGLARSESDAGITWDPLPKVMGDATLLTQLLQNLIGNAIKFRSEEPPRVKISAERDGDFWEFACSDNGIGIDAAYAERIFLIFQRLHPKDEYAGTGIGLALCKKIVEYHGGRIWLDTAPEQKGTTIRWTLPAIEETDDSDDSLDSTETAE
ncbi:sensor histidine kinase [Actinoallomurus rhizosphaericola]|uniref:sensor histidine kinase n=1 Tax=Actinoallomurus rhizosphaericola TaxID=2952536 RepID=UPI00209003D8|nr:ATP-binding protein [Actinoallomurus rhizosphaericola]MCO5992630.1 ATP-binding protein [Actinoallomurus rhizosphaericola]